MTLAEEILKKYKIKPEKLDELLSAEISKDKELQTLLEKEKDQEKLKKYRIYKDFLKKIKKKVYYQLRTYKRESRNPEETHLSTLERKNDKTLFFAHIDPEVYKAKTIIDVGGGIFAVTFRFEKYPNLEKYVLIEKDRRACEIVRQLHNGKIFLHCENIGEHPWNYYTVHSEPFDIAFMFKLIPLIKRQDKDLLPFLAQIPAKKIIITGSKTSMTKNQNIEAREEKVIRQFIEQTSRRIEKRFEIDTEFGYVIA